MTEPSPLEVPLAFKSIAVATGLVFAFNIGADPALDRAASHLEFSLERGIVIGLGYSALVGTIRYLKQFAHYPSGYYSGYTDPDKRQQLEKPSNIDGARAAIAAFEADDEYHRRLTSNRIGTFVNKMLYYAGWGRHREDIRADLAEASDNLTEVWRNLLGYEPDI